MQTLFYILIILSVLLGLTIAGLGVMLGWIVRSFYVNSDQVWGSSIIVCSLFYAAHPTLAYWLFKNSHEQLGLGVAGFSIVLSIALMFFLISAIEAGARP